VLRALPEVRAVRRALAALALCSGFAASAAELAEPSATRADFALRRAAMTSRLRIQSASLLPGQTLELAGVDRAGAPLPIAVEGASGLERIDASRVRFRAGTKPGLNTLRVRSDAAREEIVLQVFVEVPASRMRGTSLDGYEIGRYPARDPNDPPPPGFIRVTEANRGTRVSPHFRLGDFLCKQKSGYPKYLVLDPRLPPKLEALLDAVHATGRRAETLVIMSGYRTPSYHRAIGDRTDRSRHLWGAAADVYLDADGDGSMDDLDRNGIVDVRDAAFLFGLADALDRAPTEDWTVGGASVYPATRAHGPFVHLDVRGRAARW